MIASGDILQKEIITNEEKINPKNTEVLQKYDFILWMRFVLNFLKLMRIGVLMTMNDCEIFTSLGKLLKNWFKFLKENVVRLNLD